MARLYRAPELIVGHSHGTPVDVWGVACCLYELHTRRFLFPGADSNHTLRAMQELIGQVPASMLATSQFKAKHFNASNEFLDLSGCGEAGRPTKFENRSSNTVLLSRICSKERRL